MKAGDNNKDQLIEALKDELQKAIAEEAAAVPEDRVAALEEPVAVPEEPVAEPSRKAKQEMASRIRQLEEKLAEKERESPSTRPQEPAAGGASGAPDSAEHRQFQRYRVAWRVAIVNEVGDNRHIFYGRVHDISKGGVSVKSDDNLFFHNPVLVMLSVPPLVPNGKVLVIKVHSRIVYTVLSSSAQQFRSGFQFLKFEGEGRKELEERLAKINPLF